MKPYNIKRLPQHSVGKAICNTSIAVYHNTPSGHHERLDSSYIHVGIGHLDSTLLQTTALYSALQSYKLLLLQITGYIDHRKPLPSISLLPNAKYSNTSDIVLETAPNSLDVDEITSWNRFISNELFTLRPDSIVELRSRTVIQSDGYASGVQRLDHTYQVTNIDTRDLLPKAIANSTKAMEYATAVI